MSILFTENWRLLLREYEWPKGPKQYGIFTRETLKLDNFRLGLKNRLQYALCIGAFDIGSRVAMFREFNAGWYRTFGACKSSYSKICTYILFHFSRVQLLKKDPNDHVGCISNFLGQRAFRTCKSTILYHF